MMVKEGVQRVTRDMCQFGMAQQHQGITHPINKPTGFMTNCGCIADRLNQIGPGKQRHLPLMSGRVKLALLNN